jgi:hypothetical protein
MIVGDSDTDVLTGRNAGVWTCGVTYGFGAHTLADAPPDFVIHDLRELPGLLDGRPQGPAREQAKDRRHSAESGVEKSHPS